MSKDPKKKPKKPKKSKKHDDFKPLTTNEQLRVRSATEEDLARDFPAGIVFGTPVRPRPVPKPEPKQWSPEQLAEFETRLAEFRAERRADQERWERYLRGDPTALRRECASCGRLFVPAPGAEGRYCSARCWLDTHADRHRGGAWYGQGPS